MEKNKVARNLKDIGQIILVLGIIGSIIGGFIFPSITYDYSLYSGYDIEETYNFTFAITGIFSSVVSSMCFFGFSEIISLLQKNLEKQDLILKRMMIQSTNMNDDEVASKMILEDIESNLPKM